MRVLFGLLVIGLSLTPLLPVTDINGKRRGFRLFQKQNKNILYLLRVQTFNF